MHKLLTTIDFMGYRPNLYINNNDSYKSPLTGIISLVIIIVSLLFVGYFGSELLLKSAPMVVVTRQTYDDFGPLTLSSKNFLFLFAIEHPNNSYYVDPTVFELEVNTYLMTNTLNNSTGIIETKFESSSIRADLCSKFYTQEDIVEKNMLLPLDKFYCVEPDKFNFTGFWASKGPYSQIKIDFNKCQNSTKNNFTCRTPEEIDQFIQGGFISIKFTTYEVDQLNFANPLKRVFFDDYNLLNSGSSLEYNILLETLRFESDNGLVMTDITTELGFSQNIKIFNKISKNKNIFSATFQGNFPGTTYKRNYVKLQSVMTQIGGFIKALMLMGSAIGYLTSKNLYFINFLQTKTFEDTNNDEEENKSKISVNNLNQKSKFNEYLKDSSNYSKSIERINNDDNKSKVSVSNFINFSKFNENIKESSNREIMKLDEYKRKANITITPFVNNKFSKNIQKSNSKKTYINKTVVDYKSQLNKGTTISVLDFIYNMICICKKFNQKSINYKVISSLKSLNTKLFSIETITRKFYDIENLKKNYITSNKVSYSYTKILFDTVIIRIENDEKEDENYIFKFE